MHERTLVPSMRQAIVTRYLGATDYRGARVKATAYAGSVTLPWDGEWFYIYRVN
jgi:hypothetical protein